jgi:hypothetical protein
MSIVGPVAVLDGTGPDLLYCRISERFLTKRGGGESEIRCFVLKAEIWR